MHFTRNQVFLLYSCTLIICIKHKNWKTASSWRIKSNLSTVFGKKNLSHFLCLLCQHHHVIFQNLYSGKQYNDKIKRKILKLNESHNTKTFPEASGKNIKFVNYLRNHTVRNTDNNSFWTKTSLLSPICFTYFHEKPQSTIFAPLTDTQYFPRKLSVTNTKNSETNRSTDLQTGCFQLTIIRFEMNLLVPRLLQWNKWFQLPKGSFHVGNIPIYPQDSVTGLLFLLHILTHQD